MTDHAHTETSPETGFAPDTRRFLARFFVAVLAILLASAGTASVLMLRSFDRELTPALEGKAEALGRSIAGQIERLVAAGNPLDRLEGIEPFLQAEIKDSPDILYAAVLDAGGRRLNGTGAPSAADQPAADQPLVRVPILVDGRTLGAIELGIDPAYIGAQKLAVSVDILIVVLVATIVAVELLLLACTLLLVRPLGIVDAMERRAAAGDLSRRLPFIGSGRWRRVAQSWNTLVRSIEETWQTLRVEIADVRRTVADAEALAELNRRIEAFGSRFRLGDPDAPRTLNRAFPSAVRAPVFLFMLAEEMSRSFLPLYIRDLYEPVPGLSAAFVIGLPITVFMLAVAIATPFAGRYADRQGVRRVFLVGMVPLVAGYLGTAFAGSVWELMAWRGLSGVGYAALYIAGQGYIAETTSADSRARGMALFMGAVFAAVVAGPALGGILADQIGARATFGVSALVALASLLLMLWLLADEPPPEGGAERPLPGFGDFRTLLTNPGFLALTLFAAVPGKIALTGFLFYIAPLYLAQLGNTLSETGRVLMAYGAATVLLTPVAAALSDRFRAPAPLVAGGGLLAGLGLMTLALRPDTTGVLLAVALLGVGHAASIAPQLALVPDACRDEAAAMGMTTVLSVFRLIERMGSVAGPLVAAALVEAYGFADAAAGIGLLCVGSAAAFLLLRLPLAARAPRPETQS